jgi:hypothetical protein
VESGKTYYYRLENVDFRGKMTAQLMAVATPGEPVASAAPETPTKGVEELQHGAPPSSTQQGGPAGSTEIQTMEPTDSAVRPPAQKPPASQGGSASRTLKPEEKTTTARLSGEPSLEPEKLQSDQGIGAPASPETPSPSIPKESIKREEGPSVPAMPSDDFRYQLTDPSGSVLMVEKVKRATIPVSEQKFRVEQQAGKVIISWLATEGMEGYTLLRSPQTGKKLAPIHDIRIPSFPPLKKDLTYRYYIIDEKTAAGNSYTYRLEGLEQNKKHKILGEVQVKTSAPIKKNPKTKVNSGEKRP